MRYGHFGAGPPRSGFWSILWKFERHTRKTKHKPINDGAALTLHGSPAFPAPLSLPSPVALKSATSHWPLFSTATQLTSTLGDIMFVFCLFSIPELCHRFLLCTHIQSDKAVRGCISSDLLISMFGCSLQDLRAAQSVPAHEKKSYNATQLERVVDSPQFRSSQRKLEVTQKFGELSDRPVTSQSKVFGRPVRLC